MYFHVLKALEFFVITSDFHRLPSVRKAFIAALSPSVTYS